MTSTTERGRRVASSLSGAWRSEPPRETMSAALEEIHEIVCSFGAGGLAWRSLSKASEGEIPSSKEAFELRQAYRMHAIEGAIRVRQIERAVSLLRARGVDPLLAKGWAAARHYPEAGLRPYGDIDLYVRAEVFDQALEALSHSGTDLPPVDLHRGCSYLADRPFDALYGRAEIARIGATDVRLFGAEDHLRLLCLHALNHGLSRPLWLCDIGAIVESCPPGFDWDLFWSGSARRAAWLRCVLAASHEILGASLERAPLDGEARKLPRWFVDAVHGSWGSRFHALEPMTSYLPREGAFAFLDAPRELLRHWPNPVEATIGVGGSFSRWPRWPHQIGYVALRAARFVARAAKPLPQREEPPEPSALADSYSNANGGAV